jgi:hypothetical protein
LAASRDRPPQGHGGAEQLSRQAVQRTQSATTQRQTSVTSVTQWYRQPVTGVPPVASATSVPSRPAASAGTSGRTWPAGRAALQRLQVGTFTGPAGTVRQRIELTAEQKAILGALGLPDPPRVLTATPAAA